MFWHLIGRPIVLQGNSLSAVSVSITSHWVPLFGEDWQTEHGKFINCKLFLTPSVHVHLTRSRFTLIETHESRDWYSSGCKRQQSDWLESPFCVATNRTELMLLKARYFHLELRFPHPACIFGLSRILSSLRFDTPKASDHIFQAWHIMIISAQSRNI